MKHLISYYRLQKYLNHAIKIPDAIIHDSKSKEGFADYKVYKVVNYESCPKESKGDVGFDYIWVLKPDRLNEFLYTVITYDWSYYLQDIIRAGCTTEEADNWQKLWRCSGVKAWENATAYQNTLFEKYGLGIKT